MDVNNIKKLRNLKEYDFELYKRSLIADEVPNMDDKYSIFDGFMYDIDFSENFSDIEFLKNISYQRFCEFYDSLNFDDFVITIIKNNKEN